MKSIVTLDVDLLFKKESDFLFNLLATYSKQELGELLKIKLSMLDTVYGYYQQPTSGVVIESYTGTSFKEITYENFNTQQQEYLGRYVCILSSVYGILNPYNTINMYRLDMNNMIFKNHDGYKNLYDYWQSHITDYFQGEDYILNLASNEYAKMLSGIDPKKIITIDFKIIKNNALTSVPIFSKQQRGKMLNYCILHSITDPKLLKKYSHDGYSFSEEYSSENHYFFIKE